VSGDGRAGATAPTTTDVVSEAAMDAARSAGFLPDSLGGYYDLRAALAAAFPHLLAAWIDGHAKAGGAVQIAEIRARWARVDAALPLHFDGPDEGDMECIVRDAKGAFFASAGHVVDSDWRADADATAIAAAPDDIAWLCAEVERLRAALTRLGGAHE
jgi:hypothetical protein